MLLASDFLTFAKKMFYAQTKNEYIVGEHHKLICDVLMDVVKGKTNRLIINIGPRYGKTELVSRLFPAFCFALNPMCRFLHLSYSWSLVTGNSIAIKQYMANPYFRYCFEAATQYKMDARDHWHTLQGGEFYATSTLGQITGFGAGRLESEHIERGAFEERFNPNNFNGAIIIDDPIRPEDALSDAVRETVNRRFETTIRNRVNSRNTPIIIIMQRLHEHDLCGYLEETEPGVWKTLSLPAIIYDEEGKEKSLWPFKFTLEELYHLKEVSPIVYETQYMQNPKPWEGLMYREFGTYDIIPFSKKNKRVNYTDSADTGSDWLCSICYVEAPDACYVTDVLFTKKPMEYTEHAMAKMIIENATEKAYVESNNGGRGFMRNVKRLCGEMNYNKCYFHGFTQTQNKQVRIFTKANEANNLILFPSDWKRRWPQFASHITGYRKEGRNEHDDGPDVLSGIVEFHGRQNGMSDTEIMKRML